MKHRRRSSLLTGLALAALAGATAAQDMAPQVTLSLDAQKRLGVAVRPLEGVRRASEIDAFAKVLDPAPLAQAESDLETAEAAAAASSAEAARSRTLHTDGGSVSAKDYEANESQARQDALKVANLRRQLDLAWGPGIAHLSEPRLRRLVEALSRGDAALVHVDTHNNEGQAGARTVKVDIGSDSVPGTVIGPARAAEPRLQSSGLIVEVTGHDAILLSVGLTQSAHIEEATSQSGVMIPREALLRFRGSDWAYVQVGPTLFERRLVLDPAPEADGFFAANGFKPGDKVVAAGATGLFAAELATPGR